jgi:FkbH-like protein
MMPEAVRLVIWDLDETFWYGTLSEGGIREYVRLHHDIVIELCKRGIMNSICSRNDHALVENILREQGLWDFFIFPSIDWMPKARRIEALIDAVQLRPATILFIDDNPHNLAEAKARIPEFQVADETSILGMLADPRFKGKDDSQLTRLAQYKLLERRKVDEVSAGDDNIEFLRGCRITVQIETNIVDHIDRAVELIQRTNQLNFTKFRLPDDPTEARRALIESVSIFHSRGGLVKVTDTYGDYGYCGFYLIKGALGHDYLEHFCFSCRILGMGVEKWLYDHIHRPQIHVVGEVLTDLNEEKLIDWVNTAPVSTRTLSVPAATQIPRVVLRGGCELDSVAHYLSFRCPDVVTETNRLSGLVFMNFNTSINLMPSLDGYGSEAAAELPNIGFSEQDVTSNLWSLPPGGVGVFSGWSDLYGMTYRHKRTGITLSFAAQGLVKQLTTVDDDDIDQLARETGLDELRKGNLVSLINHVRSEYEAVGELTGKELRRNMKAIFSAVPSSASLFVLLVHERGVGGTPRKFYNRPEAPRYNRIIREVAAAFPNVHLIDVGALVKNVDDCQLLVDHFDRAIYFRIYELIVAQIDKKFGAAAA